MSEGFSHRVMDVGCTELITACPRAHAKGRFQQICPTLRGEAMQTRKQVELSLATNNPGGICR